MLFIKLFLALHITRSGQVSAFTPSCIRSRSFSGFRSLAHVAKMDDLLHQRKTCRSPPLKFTQSRARPASPLRASSSASLAASAGLGGSGLRFPWSPAAASAALFSLASLFPVKDAQGRSPSDDVAIEDHEEPARAILVKGLRVAGTAALLYFVKEYVEYQKRSEIAAVLAKEKMYKAEMYFDAVRDILTRLQNPRLRPSVAGDLRAQLEQLDPQGRIQKFYATGADPRKKPDISDIVEANTRRHRGENVENVSRSGDPSAHEQIKASLMPVTTSSAALGPSSSFPASSSHSGGSDPDVQLLMRQLTEELRSYGFDGFAIKSAVNSLEAPLLKLDRYARLLAMERIRSQLGNEKYWAKYVNNVFA